jgi:hypothetical protein
MMINDDEGNIVIILTITINDSFQRYQIMIIPMI